MESYYKRTEDIEQKIHSVKLPFLAWKVLFLIDEKQDLKDLKALLSEDESVLQEALDILETEGLIRRVEEEPEAEPEVEEEPPVQVEAGEKEEEVEAPEEEGSITEIIEEEVVEETIIREEVEQPLEEPEESLFDEDTTEAVEEAEEPGFFEEEEKEPDQEEAVEEPEKEEEPEEPVQKETDIFAEEMPDFVIGKPKEPEEKQEEPEDEEAELAELEDSSIFDEPEVKEADEEIEISEEKSEEDVFKLDIDFDEQLEEEQTTEEPIAEEMPPEQGLSHGEGIILVIDDSIVIRKMVELALENEDFQIETAVTGKDGLKLLDQLQPDLVILDLMLPDINGIDLLKTIKASKGIPVVMLSGKDSPQTIEKARAEGADAFLPKPFRDEELVQTIKKLIKK